MYYLKQLMPRDTGNHQIEYDENAKPGISRTRLSHESAFDIDRRSNLTPDV